ADVSEKSPGYSRHSDLSFEIVLVARRFAKPADESHHEGGQMVHEKAPDEKRDPYVHDENSCQPASSLGGTYFEKGDQGQDAKEVFCSIGQGPAMTEPQPRL